MDDEQERRPEQPPQPCAIPDEKFREALDWALEEHAETLRKLADK